MRRHLLVSVMGAGLLAACANAPKSVTADEMAASAATLRASLATEQTAALQSVSLYDAMARALKHNLDHRVAMMEIDLAQRDYDLSRYDLLPKIVANGGYYGRSNRPGASSRSLLSGRESLEPSTSTDQFLWTGDLGASWNVLDFGLSAIRSEQLGNEALIQEERRRKAIIQIMEDVHAAYYRALSAERLSTSLSSLEADVQNAFDQSRAQYQSRQTAPMPALSYQRELKDIQAQAQALNRELKTSRMALAALMGLSPDQDFRLADQQASTPRALAMSYSDMIDVALANRPEVRETIYAQRIGQAEMRAAVLEAFPGIEGFAGLNTSSNQFLFNKDWADYGVRASWNLLKVFSTGTRKKKAAARAKLEEQRGLAAAMAVMTQVGVARMEYESLMAEYETARSAASVQGEITSQIEAQAQARRASNQTLVRERMNRILADARRDRLHAELARSAAHIYTALGQDPYGADVDGREDIATLSASMRELWMARAGAPGAVASSAANSVNVAAP